LVIVHFSVASNFVLAHCFLFLPTFNPHMPSTQFMCPPSNSTIIVKSIVTTSHKVCYSCIVMNMHQKTYHNIFYTNSIGHARFIVMRLHVLLLTLFVLLSLHCILIVFSKFMFCHHCKFVLAFKNTIRYSPPHYTCTMDNARWRGKVFLVSKIIP